jgi:NitT/TauT family transport system ATP-binding protein
VAALMLTVAIARKAFGSHVVIEGLRLRIGAGEIVALAGPSGCGKTTLMRIVGGLDTEYQGSIGWDGGTPPRIGTVFQEPRLLPWRTVRQNLALVAPKIEAGALLEELGLAAFADAYPKRLSLGMARRVALARAFATAPDVLLMDEPFASLDAETAERSRALLLRVWQSRPTSVLLVTHDLIEAVSLADRIVLLSKDPMRVEREVDIPRSIRRSGGEAAARFALGLRPPPEMVR